jgi:ribosome modulation factor
MNEDSKETPFEQGQNAWLAAIAYSECPYPPEAAEARAQWQAGYAAERNVAQTQPPAPHETSA